MDIETSSNAASQPTARTSAQTRTRIRARIRVAAAAAAAVLALTISGCTAADTGTTAPATGSTPTSTTPASPAGEVALPATPLGEQAGWVLSALNGEVDAAAVAAGISERFAPMALDQIGAEELATVFEQIGAEGPWLPTAVQDGGTQAVITITAAAGDSLDMQIAVDADELIGGLLFAPAAADRTAATSWSGLDDAVGDFTADTRLVVTELTDDGSASEPVAVAANAGASDLDEAMPSGSMFKLYVLGAVADAVESGDLTWETELTVTDDLKSLPSGELQNQPAGTVVTVREAAAKMISISDNTATDMLIAAVGPAAVERQFAEMGHHDPELNTPLLTTRALFQLGWGTTEIEAAGRGAWAHAGEAERRRIIEALPAGVPDIVVTDLVEPVWQLGLDWFTTPADLTAAHLALQQKAETATGEPVRDILAENNGLGSTLGDEWSYVAFKGGSSLGVLAGSWYLERQDGRAFTISIQGSSDDPAELADQATFFGQVQDAVALLEGE
jgi:hypothetical protein